MNNRFLPKHEDKAEDESNCFKRSLELAIQFENLGNFNSAAFHLESAQRSLRALQDMRDMLVDAYTIKPVDVKSYE